MNKTNKLKNTKIHEELKKLKQENLIMTNKIKALKDTQEYKELMELKQEYRKLENINTSLEIELSTLTQLFQDNSVKINFDINETEGKIND